MNGSTLFAQGAPRGLVDDLILLDELSPEAQQGLWSVVAKNVGATIGEHAERDAARFADQHGIPMETLVAVVRSARVVIRSAAKLDLPTEVVHADVLAISRRPAVARRIAALYEKARLPLRAEATIAAVERFGAVLTAVDLRVDMVSISRSDPSKGVPVGMLSIDYREHGEDKHCVLQVTPVLLERLRTLLAAGS